MAVHGVITISSNDGNGNLVTFNTMYMGSTYDMEIRQDGIVFEGLKSDGTQIPAESWTYEGQGKFLGLSTTSGATAPDDGCSVGSTIKFEGLDDAYYYIVEEELKGEPPTAESVKSKLQSLITASNAKTGKSDANLTDAVKTLLEGYGQGGGGGGECSGNHIIEVDELPEVGVEGAIYGVPTFSDVYLVMGEQKMLIGTMGGKCAFDTATTNTIGNSPINVGLSNWCNLAFYYLTDIPDIYMAQNGLPYNPPSLGDEFGIPFKGEITDIANATEDGYYAYIGKLTLYQYRDGAYVRMNEQGKLIFVSNGDGTCCVEWLTANPNAHIVIPSVSPLGDTVTKINESAFRASVIRAVTIPDTIKEIEFYAFMASYALQSIIFDGTVEQWNAITKGDNWNLYVPATRVTCSDGDVRLL